jgi:hypothetical protein
MFPLIYRSIPTSALTPTVAEHLVVRALYQLITRSRRHRDCDLLLTRHCDARSFPKWTMAYRTVENEIDLKQKIARLKANRDARNAARQIAS